MDGAIRKLSKESEGISGGSFVQGLRYGDSLAQKCCNISNKEVGMCVATMEDPNVPVCNEVAELIVQDLGNNFQGMLHISDSSQQLFVNNATPYQDKMDDSVKIRMIQEMNSSFPLDANVGKSLNRSLTFPSPEEVQTCSAPINCRKGLLSMLLDDPNSSKSENPTYERSMLLPASSSLVSAMKGGREQSGISLEIKLQVKWAPEVYDPPATSMSHTVRSHHRPKTRRKEQYKHKHKGKSSRSKHTNKTGGGNKINPSAMRPKEVCEELLLDGCYQSEFALTSQEAKCGGNFLRESLAKVQLPIAEV